jgi:hypothetical protein
MHNRAGPLKVGISKRVLIRNSSEILRESVPTCEIPQLAQAPPAKQPLEPVTLPVPGPRTPPCSLVH